MHGGGRIVPMYRVTAPTTLLVGVKFLFALLIALWCHQSAQPYAAAVRHLDGSHASLFDEKDVDWKLLNTDLTFSDLYDKNDRSKDTSTEAMTNADDSVLRQDHDGYCDDQPDVNCDSSVSGCDMTPTTVCDDEPDHGCDDDGYHCDSFPGKGVTQWYRSLQQRSVTLCQVHLPW